MPASILPRPAGGFAPVFTPPRLRVPSPVNPPVFPRPASGRDGIADFLASLMKEYESAAAIFSPTRRL